jgi:hypothetical protein
MMRTLQAIKLKVEKNTYKMYFNNYFRSNRLEI